MISKDTILTLIAEEKEAFSQYSQQCSNYQVKPDPLAIARNQAKLELLKKLLQIESSSKS